MRPPQPSVACCGVLIALHGLATAGLCAYGTCQAGCSAVVMTGYMWGATLGVTVPALSRAMRRSGRARRREQRSCSRQRCECGRKGMERGELFGRTDCPFARMRVVRVLVLSTDNATILWELCNSCKWKAAFALNL